MSGHGVLQVTGADRAEFLHGQLSSDVKGLAAGQYRQALMLNHKGHAHAQLQVLRPGSELLLLIEGGALAQVTAQLEAHIIFDQVELETLSGWRSLTLQGPRAQEILREAGLEPPTNSNFLQSSDLLLYPNQRSAAGGYDLHGPVEAVTVYAERLQSAGAVPVSNAALQAARVEAGVPLAWAEAGEGVLPQEAGLEFYVSYTKGCYLGQEIMARIEARGTLRRELVRLKLSGLPAEGERGITAEGKTVGRLGTVAVHPEEGVIALAVLRRDVNAELHIGKVEAAVWA